MRLRRSDPNTAGYTRRRHGRGFGYRDQTGAVLTDPQELERIRGLAIPPAWRNVWISPHPRGHIQAIGVDAAGRRQYRYHDEWRVQRDAAKFDHVLEVGERLPAIREVVDEQLAERGLTRNRVLAAAVRLLDVGCFRIGGEEYAAGTDATFGLATIRRDHVSLVPGAVRFCYPAKGGIERALEVPDEAVRTVVRGLLARRSDAPELLAYRAGTGWCDVRSTDINGYLREVGGIDISAKDFRTWNATVLAAIMLAAHTRDVAAQRRRPSPTARQRTVAAVMRDVAEYLGNTPAVARASYVDPRVVDLFADGVTIPAAPRLADGSRPVDTATRQALERDVLDLLRTDGS
ncbi:MAG: topoisomerase [Micromonosporaceae bacterium]|nr:topoisomerase [Micromonosporaceae bacterium]